LVSKLERVQHSKKKLFETLEIYKNVEFVATDEFFNVKSKNIDFTMPHETKEAIAQLSLAYPQEREAIYRYFDLIGSVFHEFGRLQSLKWWEMLLFPFIFKNIFKYRTTSLKEIMDKLFKSEEIKLILNSNIGYYHHKIADFSFLFHAIAQHSYFSGGSWFIKGGSQKLSNYLASIITNNGGEVLTKADVVEIKHDNKKITSVLYTHKKVSKELHSDIVISNLSPLSTYTLSNIAYNEPKEVSSSYFVIYFGFNQNLKKHYGKKAYSQFFLDVETIDEYDELMNEDISKRGFVFVDYSQIDSALCDENSSYASICTSDFLANWEHLDELEYKAKKEEFLQKYLTVLEKHYPNLKEYLVFAEVGTPRTIQRYIKTPNGTPNGFAPTAKQFFRIPKVDSNKLSNLYFTGAWIMGGGFSTAMISGKLCADEILKS